MKTYLPKKAKDIKGAVAIAELRRAHYIIAMLASSFAVMILFVSTFEIQFNAVLGLIAVLLLAVVAIVSLGTALVLGKK